MKKPSLKFLFKKSLAGVFGITFFILAPKLWAAACCGGGFSAPALVASDDNAQLTTSFAYTEIKKDVYTSGLWSQRSDSETNETFRLEGAHIFADRWQAGLIVPVVRRARHSESSSGFGDIAVTLGYEYLPDWDYNPWRPKGLGYLQLTLPTGRAIQESEEASLLDSRGRGFWAIGAGTLLAKIIRKWDVFASLDAHHSFDKSYSDSSGRSTLEPGWGGGIGLGGGYNWAQTRIGSSVTWSYEDPVNVSGAISSRGALERSTTVQFTAGYLIEDEWSSSVSYSDQTLLGSPSNTRLGRGVILQLQRRWSR